jgi:hypothetical protein
LALRFNEVVPINCVIGYLDISPPAASCVFAVGGIGLDAVFSAALEPVALNLTFQYDWSAARRLSQDATRLAVSPDDLETALATLLQDSKSTSSIGVIITNECSLDQDAFGMMFDNDGIHGSTIGPRRGIALFMNSIGNQAQANNLTDDQLNTFVSYVLLHELGHAFNLWHLRNSGTIMDPTIRPLPFTDPDNCKPGAHMVSFDEAHREFLRRLDGQQPQYVLPGGCKFGDRPGITVIDDSAFGRARASSAPLQLAIALSHETFTCYEPVEMSVVVALASGSVAVPVPTIDPAYEALAIDIMGRDGVWRSFRPLFRFCHEGSPISITPGALVSRDIPIWRESGGCTSDAPGRYSIRARLHIDHYMLMSNVVDCDVVRSNHWGAYPSILKPPLARDDTQTALLYGTDWKRSVHRDRLLTSAMVRTDDPTSSSLLYAAGTSALRRSGKTGDTGERRHAAHWLEAAEKEHAVTTARRLKIVELLQTL